MRTTTMSHRPASPTVARVFAAGLAILIAGAGAAAAQSDAPPAYGDSSYSNAAYGDPNTDQPAGYDSSYSYVRELDGSATVIQAGSGERDAVEVNLPLLPGDRLWVAPGSRLEVLLSDGNVLRLDADSDVFFERLAYSPESGDRATVLRMERGNAQVQVLEWALGDDPPRIETPNASVALRDRGSYRLTTAGGDWTEVTVRRGTADVTSDRGGLEVRADEQAIVEGAQAPRVAVRAADALDSLERWGRSLDDRAADVTCVDEPLRYAAAPLNDYGSWVEVSGSYAWRPRVDTGWRPYWNGRWAYTPGGLTWVSSEPWGWVPYHYGTWDLAPGYGWVWYPGRRFAPAWVYWYWGPSQVAWVPMGYYTRHYGRDYPGFRFGVYGWAGGSWGFYSDWVFCSTGYFGSRHQNRYLYDGAGWQRHYGGRDVPRGIVTTDTRRLRPEVWNRPNEAIDILRTRPNPGRRIADGGELPDVTSFVARKGDLPDDVRRRVVVSDRDAGGVAGTPLAPRTAARPPAEERRGVRGWSDSASTGASDAGRRAEVKTNSRPSPPAESGRAAGWNPRSDAADARNARPRDTAPGATAGTAPSPTAPRTGATDSGDRRWATKPDARTDTRTDTRTTTPPAAADSGNDGAVRGDDRGWQTRNARPGDTATPRSAEPPGAARRTWGVTGDRKPAEQAAPRATVPPAERPRIDPAPEPGRRPPAAAAPRSTPGDPRSDSRPSSDSRTRSISPTPRSYSPPAESRSPAPASKPGDRWQSRSQERPSSASPPPTASPRSDSRDRSYSPTPRSYSPPPRSYSPPATAPRAPSRSPSATAPPSRRPAPSSPPSASAPSRPTTSRPVPSRPAPSASSAPRSSGGGRSSAPAKKRQARPRGNGRG